MKSKKTIIIICILILLIILAGVFLITKNNKITGGEIAKSIGNSNKKIKNSEMRKLTFYNHANKSDWMGNLPIPQEYSIYINIKDNKFAKFTLKNNFYSSNYIELTYAKGRNKFLCNYYYEPYNCFTLISDINHTGGEEGYNLLKNNMSTYKTNKRVEYKDKEILLYGDENYFKAEIVYNVSGKYFRVVVNNNKNQPDIDFGKVTAIEDYSTTETRLNIDETIEVCKSIIDNIDCEAVQDDNNAGLIKIGTDMNYVDLFNDGSLFLDLRNDNVDVNYWYRNKAEKIGGISNSVQISSRKKELKILVVEFKETVEDIDKLNKEKYPLVKHTINGIDVYAQMVNDEKDYSFNGKSTGMFYIMSKDNHFIGIQNSTSVLGVIDKDKVESTLQDIFDCFFTTEKPN